MIYLIHGRNVIDSRRFLVRLKSAYGSVEVVVGKTLTKTNFEERLQEANQYLFSGKTAFLVEDFKGVWPGLSSNLPEDVDIIFWAADKVETIPPGVKSYLFQTQIKANPFRLVDAVLFKDEKSSQELCQQLLTEKESPEKIIGLLARSFCLVYSSKDGSLDKSKTAQFLVDKLSQQSQVWKAYEIKKALVALLQADLSLKEGAKPAIVFTSLVSQLTG